MPSGGGHIINARPMLHQHCLLKLSLDRHETHRRLHHGDADGFCIRRIRLASLDEALDVGGRDQPHLMAQLPDLSAPEMGATTGFHRHDTGWQLGEEGQHLMPPQLPSQDRLA